MLFYRSRKPDNVNEITLYINDRLLDRTASMKVLGVYMDEMLCWNEHITK